MELTRRICPVFNLSREKQFYGNDQKHADTGGGKHFNDKIKDITKMQQFQE